MKRQFQLLIEYVEKHPTYDGFLRIGTETLSCHSNLFGVGTCYKPKKPIWIELISKLPICDEHKNKIEKYYPKLTYKRGRSNLYLIQGSRVHDNSLSLRNGYLWRGMCIRCLKFFPAKNLDNSLSLKEGKLSYHERGLIFSFSRVQCNEGKYTWKKERRLQLCKQCSIFLLKKALKDLQKETTEEAGDRILRVHKKTYPWYYA